ALWMVGPKTIAGHIVPTITTSAERAGRPAPRVVAGLPVCVTADVGAAAAMAGKAFGFYNDLPAYRAMLDREGADGPVDLAVIGDEESVATRIRALGDLGVTDLSLPVFGSSADRTRTLDLLTEMARDGA
ncbi:MAG: LLM class F420-dependent oxidoreductase, partial [Acidimicrobiales bacterium]